MCKEIYVLLLEQYGGHGNVGNGTIHKHKRILNLGAVKQNATIKQCQIHLFPVYSVNVQEAK